MSQPMLCLKHSLEKQTMKAYTKQDFHNPEQLTRQQVGDEYRLLLCGEKTSSKCETASNYNRIWFTTDSQFRSCWTYRVPLATPLPDGTVLSSNECCFSDAQYCAHCEGECLIFTASGCKGEEGPSGSDRKKIYVAGSMSAHPEDFNFPTFYAASESLERQGWEAVNPAQLDTEVNYPLERLKQLSPAEFQEFLKGAAKRDLEALQQCDSIALLPGWESSKGARAEKAVAEWLGIEIFFLLDERYLPKKGFALLSQSEYESALRNATFVSLPEHKSGRLGVNGPGPCPIREPGPRLVEDVGVDDAGFFGTEAVNYIDRDIHGREIGRGATIQPDDPKGVAGAKKPPMWLLPPYALQQTAWVHKLGSEKYDGPYNWRETSVCATTYISAIMRHLDAWRDGEDNDPESGISHIAHMAASCNILLDARHCGKLNDDRAKSCQI
ncbi:MAG: DUF4406 domain-containing protein [Desulfurellales bacterium]|nr:MAG: DUF4406 domain-containing protein [Desulfurellales bacterium]